MALPDGLIVINPGMKFEITDGADLNRGSVQAAAARDGAGDAGVVVARTPR